MNKYIWLVAILVIIIVALVGIFILWPTKNPVNAPVAQEGIQITSPKANEEISSPLKITGVTSGWNGFEGQVGTVKLLDYNGNQLASGILTATTDWMVPPTSFETTLNFTAANSGPGTLVFNNENPSGLPEYDKTFTLPVKINAESETMIVKVYFGKNEITGSTCNVVFPVDRVIPKTTAVLRATLEELLKGPTEQEKSRGYFTSIPSGTKLNRVAIENRTAIADFSKELDPHGGSCRVTEIWSEIQNTAKQFPTVDEIIVSIDGSTEEILQP